MKRITAAICMIILSAALSAAQSNQAIDQLLESSMITAGQMSYILLAASGELSAADDEASAFNKVSLRTSCLEEYNYVTAIPLDVFMCTMMSVLEMKGGIMYSIFKNPGYAFKEMTFKGIIKPTENPSAYFSGEYLLSTVQRAINWRDTYQ